MYKILTSLVAIVALSATGCTAHTRKPAAITGAVIAGTGTLLVINGSQYDLDGEDSEAAVLGVLSGAVLVGIGLVVLGVAALSSPEPVAPAQAAHSTPAMRPADEHAPALALPGATRTSPVLSMR